MDLETLAKRYEQCTMCPLHQRRTQVVMGEGNPRSPLMIVGEGPGADEVARPPFRRQSGTTVE